MKQKILVELDALLDTRLAVVATLSDAAAAELVSPEYRDRPSDELGRLTSLITTEQFQEAYKKRTEAILPYARPTMILFMLDKIIERLEREMLVLADKTDSTEVEVNVYPYKLNAEVMEEIAITVMARVGTVTPVKCVYYPPFHLTPMIISRSEYSALIIYNLQDWIDNALKVELRENELCPSVTLMAPALLKTLDGIPAPEEMKDSKGDFTDPFSTHARMLGPVIGLEFTPVEFFSLMDLEALMQTEKVT